MKINPIKTIVPTHPIATIDPYQPQSSKKPISALPPVNMDMIEGYRKRQNDDLFSEQKSANPLKSEEEAITELFKEALPNLQPDDKSALKRILEPLLGTLNIPSATTSDISIESGQFTAATVTAGVLQPRQQMQTATTVYDVDGLPVTEVAHGDTGEVQSIQTLSELLNRITSTRNERVTNLSAHAKIMAGLAGVAMACGLPSFITAIRAEVDLAARDEFEILCVWNAALAGDAKTLLMLLQSGNVAKCLARYPQMWECWCRNYNGAFSDQPADGLVCYETLHDLIWPAGNADVSWLFYANEKLLSFLFCHLQNPAFAHACLVYPTAKPVVHHNPHAFYMF